MKPARLVLFAKLTASTAAAGLTAITKSALVLVKEKGLSEVKAETV